MRQYKPKQNKYKKLKQIKLKLIISRNKNKITIKKQTKK